MTLKANFDEIYTADDPRPYYRTLGSFDYQIPTHSGTVFGQLAEAFADGSSPAIVDLCCSYGVNATVLNHDLDFGQVVDHYCDPSIGDLERGDLVAHDQEWYAAHRRDHPIRVCGVDISEPAIDYALDAGLLDAGFAEDLERHDASPGLAAEIGAADLITVSGGIGYITDRTIDRVLALAEQQRVAALCLRWIDFGPIVDAAAARGLVTERLDDATFPQRRFASDAEERHVFTELARLGVDPEGREADGYHHTDLFVLRPAAEARARPLVDVLAPAGAIGDRGEPLTSRDTIDVSVVSSNDS